MDELVKRLRLQAEVDKFYSGEPMLYDKAADAIEELQQIAWHYEETAKDYFKDVCYYLERVPKWIPVEERLPNENGEYLVSGKDKVWVCEFMILGDVGGWCNSARNPCVKYWMQLPEPPKEGGE